MGQQLSIRLKRQRRKSWIERKKKADKAKAKPAAAKAPPATPAHSNDGPVENAAKPDEVKAAN